MSPVLFMFFNETLIKALKRSQKVCIINMYVTFDLYG